jgi:hypothetical protein
LIFYQEGVKNFCNRALRKIELNIQLNKLKAIDGKLKRNYQLVQGLLMSKTWEDKLAMYQDKEVARYIGPNGLNARLLLEAKKIGDRHKINLEAQFTLLAYLYKEKNNNIVLGFIGLDCAGINILKN